KCVAVAVHGGQAKLFHGHGLCVKGSERQQCGGTDGQPGDASTTHVLQRAQVFLRGMEIHRYPLSVLCCSGDRYVITPLRRGAYANTMRLKDVAVRFVLCHGVAAFCFAASATCVFSRRCSVSK